MSTQTVGRPFSSPIILTSTTDLKKGDLIRIQCEFFKILFSLSIDKVTLNDIDLPLEFIMDTSVLSDTSKWSYFSTARPLAEFRIKEDTPAGSEFNIELHYKSGSEITSALSWGFILSRINDHEQRDGECCSDVTRISFMADEPVHMEAYLKSDGRLLIQYFDKYMNPTVNDSHYFYLEYGSETKRVEAAIGLDAKEYILPVQNLTRVKVKDEFGRETMSNYYPVVFSKNVYFGEFHWHCEFSSDGQRPLYDALYSARYQLGLDFAGSGDHIWKHGVYKQPESKFNVKEQGKICNSITQDSKFSSIAGCECNGCRGHANIYSRSFKKFEECMTSEPDKINIVINNTLKYPLKQLNELITDNETMIIPHHTNTDSFNQGGYVGSDGLPSWGAMPWPNNGSEYEHVRLIEIVQGLGSFETEQYQENWHMKKNTGGLGGSAMTALTKGFKIGFCGGTDNHSGWPTGVASGNKPCGITGVLADELTDGAVFDNLYERHCYATTGARIIAAARMDNLLMGSQVYQSPAQKRMIEIEIHGTAPIECVEIMHTGFVIAELETDGSCDFIGSWEDTRPGREFSETWYYVRARQTDGECVWISPFFIDLK